MGEEGISRKILLMIVDKLVIGIIAALIVLIFNAQYDAYQREREERIAVAKVHTEILMHLRTEFINETEELFLRVNPIVKGEASDSAVMIIGELTERICNALYNIVTIDPDMANLSGPMRNSLKEINGYVLEISRATASDLQATRNLLSDEIINLRKAYGYLLGDIQESCLDAIKKDLEAASK